MTCSPSKPTSCSPTPPPHPVANTLVFYLVFKDKKLRTHSYIAVLATIDCTTALSFSTLYSLRSCTAALYVLGERVARMGEAFVGIVDQGGAFKVSTHPRNCATGS